MGQKSEILGALREYLQRGPGVISEDIEPESLIAIDVMPLGDNDELELGRRKYVISVLCFGAASTTGSADPGSKGEFDGGTEFVSKHPDFHNLSEEELLKYRVDFVPHDLGDIPAWLPDYQGYMYEDGGLDSVWSGTGTSRDERVRQSEIDDQYNQDLDPGKGGPAETARVFDIVSAGRIETGRWINIPADEIPRDRPIGSFGYPKLERRKIGPGKYKYSPYRRRLPEVFVDPRTGVVGKTSSNSYNLSEKIKTPWILFMDWWELAWKKAKEKGIFSLVQGTDEMRQKDKDGELGKTRAANDLMARAEQLKAKIKAKKAGPQNSQTAEHLDALYGDLIEAEVQYDLLKRYGLSGLGDFRKQIDYEAAPIRGRHPRKYGSPWAADVDDINRQAFKHNLTHGELEAYSDLVASIESGSDVPVGMNLDDPRGPFADIGSMQADASDKTFRQGQRRMAASNPNYKAQPRISKFDQSDRSDPVQNLELKLLARRAQEHMQRLLASGEMDEVEAQQTLNKIYLPLAEKIRAKAQARTEGAEGAIIRYISEALGDFATEPSSEPEPVALGYETHCKKCRFPAFEAQPHLGLDAIYGKDPYEKVPGHSRPTRSKSQVTTDDDIHVVQYQYTPISLGYELSKSKASAGKWEIGLEAAQSLLSVLQSQKPPKWLKFNLEERRYTEEDQKGAAGSQEAEAEYKQWADANSDATYSDMEIKHAEIYFKRGLPPMGFDVEIPNDSIVGRPKGRTFGRILISTATRQVGKAPGHATSEHPADVADKYGQDSEQYKKLEKNIAYASKAGGKDPSGPGEISLFPIKNVGSRQYKITDPEGDEVFDARALAHDDEDVRDVAWDALKKFVRDAHTTGSIGQAKARGISGRQSLVKKEKDRKFRELQVKSLLGLLDTVQDATNNFITYRGLPSGYEPAQVVKALEAAIARLEWGRISLADMDSEQFSRVQRRARDNILKWMEKVVEDPLLEIGDLLEGYHRHQEAVESGNYGRAIMASEMIEEALDKLSPHSSSELDDDVGRLLHFKRSCVQARHALSENKDLRAATLALLGYHSSAKTLTESQIEEILVLREGAGGPLRGLVKKASSILALESYGQAVNVFKRVAPKLGFFDLHFLPSIVPQRIINNGRLADDKIEAVLEDIGLSLPHLVSKSKNRSFVKVWDKIGYL